MSTIESLEQRALLSISFLPAVQYPAGTDPELIATADFNRDGKADLAVGDAATGLVQVLLGRGDGTFAPMSNTGFPAGKSISSIVVGDFNRDGRLDLAVANNLALGTVSVLLGNGNGTFQPPVAYYIGGNPQKLAVADVNHDGVPDIVAADASPWTINPLSLMPSSFGAAVLLGNGDGTFQTVSKIPTLGAVRALAVGDFNRDGNQDVAMTVFPPVAIAIYPPPSSVQTALGVGDGTFNLGPPTTLLGTVTSLAAADLNRDGKIDLAVTLANLPLPIATAGVSSFSNGVGVMLGKGDGSFALPAVQRSALALSDVAVADFDLDGKLDVASGGYNPMILSPVRIGSLAVYPGNGDGTLGTPFFAASVPAPVTLAVGQFNRDALPDIAITQGYGGGAGVFINNTNLGVGTGVTFKATEGQPFVDKTVALFRLNALTAVAANSATIDWGDGTTSIGKIVPAPAATATAAGAFAVLGSHTYAEEGTYPVTVMVSGLASIPPLVIKSTAKVADAPLVGAGVDFTATAGVPVTDQLVATFQDQGANEPVGNYSALISWGDPSPTAVPVFTPGKIQLNNGVYEVLGSHTYLTPGQYVLTVLIRDAGGSTVRVTATVEVLAPPTAASE
jgi:hypothetical protein